MRRILAGANDTPQAGLHQGADGLPFHRSLGHTGRETCTIEIEVYARRAMA